MARQEARELLVVEVHPMTNGLFSTFKVSPGIDAETEGRFRTILVPVPRAFDNRLTPTLWPGGS